MIHRLRSGAGHPRTALILMVTATVLLTLVGLSSPRALAAPQTKYYDISATPTSVYLGVQTNVTVALENDPSSTQSFGSAELDFGTLAATAVDTANLTNSAGWTDTVVSTDPLVVLLTSGSATAIAPNSLLTINFPLTAPTAASVTIDSVVKQSNNFSGNGNDFAPLDGNPAATVGVIPATLQFVQQPSTVQAGTPASPVYMCPAVSVSVTAQGNPVPGAPVVLNYAGTNDPGLYYDGNSVTSLGVTVTTASNGVATFGDCSNSAPPSGLGATNIGSGYTLSASSPDAAGAITSDPFSVVQSAQVCTATTSYTCGFSNLSGSSGTTATGQATGTSSFDLLGSFGLGTLGCDSQVTTGTADPFVVATSNDSAYVVLSLTFPKKVVNSLANNGTPLMPVCAGAKTAFPGSNSASSPLPSPPNAFPYEGLLPDCTSTTLSTLGATGFCVLSRAKNAGASETIQIYVGDNYAVDPMVW